MRSLSLAFLLALFAMTGRLFAEPPGPGKLLAVRPEVPTIKVEQGGSTGYIVWTPTLTLAQAIEIAGGFAPKTTTIMITRWSEDPAPDAQFSRKKYLQDPAIQSQVLHQYDRVTLTYFLRM